MYAHSPYNIDHSQSSGRPHWRGPTLRSIAFGAAFGLTLATPSPVQAETLHCGAEDVPCLIAAITEANTNVEAVNELIRLPI